MLVSLVLAVVIAGTTAQNRAQLTFVPFGLGLPSAGQWREGFRLADMNGDGHLDIIHGPPRKQASFPVIFLGDGKGSFTRWKEARFPSLPYDYGDVEVADFNGDGHPDLALAIHHGGIYILKGDGRGNFTDATAGPLVEAHGAGFSSRAIRVTDWNGDGRPDLVAAWEGPVPGRSRQDAGMLVFLNGGDKGWRRADYTMSPGIYSDSLAIGDFDGDGHGDAASGASVLGRSDLVNLSRVDHAQAGAVVPIPGSVHYVYAVGAGDFDNDGRDDLAVGYVSLESDIWYSIVDIYFSRAGSRWERAQLSKERSRNVALAMATGHLRDRRTRDLVLLTSQGQTIVFLGDGSGRFKRNDAVPVYGGGCRGAHVELADLDGDGLDEIVASFADEPQGVGADAVCPTGGGITAWKPVRK
ncbi:MAG TPA: VCBS repeat-containing protein [Bryobacteraceae bacterium]|nr:VCBS repeat-containing protein [Bryobacteraceae bacterium]